MKLEFLDDISDGGRYKNVVSERLVRIFDFNNVEVSELLFVIESTVLQKKNSLNLHDLRFINSIKCKLTLSIADKNYGIVKRREPEHFICQLNLDGYKNLVERIKLTTDDGYNWLYDDSIENIDFLFSKTGTW